MQKSSLKPVFIGIGANLGDRFLNLTQALEAFKSRLDFLNVEVSSIYETKPFEADGPDYLNAVVGFATTWSADKIHAWLQLQEQNAGRVRTVLNAPRTLDLDFLFYGDEMISTKELKVPHPRLHERAFVLLPLAEIAPDFVHPVLKKSIRELTDALSAEDLSDVGKFKNKTRSRIRSGMTAEAV